MANEFKSMFAVGQQWIGTRTVTAPAKAVRETVRIVEYVGEREVHFRTPECERYITALPEDQEVMVKRSGFIRFKRANYEVVLACQH